LQWELTTINALMHLPNQQWRIELLLFRLSKGPFDSPRAQVNYWRAAGTLILLGAVIIKADTVLDWNIVALKTTAAAPINPPVESRSLAIVHAAMFDAINSIIGEFRPYAVELSASKGASPDAAGAAAAHFALVRLYPAQQAPLGAAYAASLSGIPDGSAKTDGMTVGEDVAAKILAMRANDGAKAAIVAPYKPGSAPGDWVPTPPAFRPALDPGWDTVRPFFLREGSQFRPEAPPTLTSPQYTGDFNEIKEIGDVTSGTRTQDQTDLARFFGYRQLRRSGIRPRDKSPSHRV
jgi:hypothetical protein